MTLLENAAYLKGLAEGLNLDETKAEGKLIAKLLVLVSDMADKIDALEDEIETHGAYLDELDHDLGELEEEVYDCLDECDCDDDDDCDCCDCDDDDECDCCCDDDDEDEVFYEVTCPACGEKVYFDETVDPSEITCPACNEKFDCVCDDDDCDCCHDHCDCDKE